MPWHVKSMKDSWRNNFQAIKSFMFHAQDIWNSEKCFRQPSLIVYEKLSNFPCGFGFRRKFLFSKQNCYSLQNYIFCHWCPIFVLAFTSHFTNQEKDREKQHFVFIACVMTRKLYGNLSFRLKMLFETRKISRVFSSCFVCVR